MTLLFLSKPYRPRAGVTSGSRPFGKLRRRALRRETRAAAYDLGYEPDVVIVGGGLAGLTCAKFFDYTPFSVALFEATGRLGKQSLSRLGGRVKTDIVDGFKLDRGFQIFLTAYPEAQSEINQQDLDLQPFYNGAMVWYDGAFHRVADPFRHPIAGVSSLLNPIGTVVDKARVGLLRLSLQNRSTEDILAAEEMTTLKYLKSMGFSDAMIDRFFRPFFGGIFFDNDLSVSSRLFEFVMKILSAGDNTLPADGIGAIPQQMAKFISNQSIHLNKEVKRVYGAGEKNVLPCIELEGKEEMIVAKQAVVVATDGPTAKKILDRALLDAAPSKKAEGVGTCCLYFSAPKAPFNGENLLFLNGSGQGIVNNCCFPSAVAPSYAPPGQTLVSVSTVGSYPEMSDEDLEQIVRKQMGKWFGAFDISAWKLIKIYRIPYAQPNQTPPTDFERPVRLGKGIYICGDHRDGATFDGAMKSGRRAIKAIMEDFEKENEDQFIQYDPVVYSSKEDY